MNIAFLKCKDFKLSEKNSFIINKETAYKNNSNELNKIKSEENCSQSDINKSNSNLEIIEYPYKSNCLKNQKVEILKYVLKQPKLFEPLNNNNFLKKKKFNVNKDNNFSGLIKSTNNEDNIINNKIEKNLFTNFNSVRNNKRNIDNDYITNNTINSNIDKNNNTNKSYINNIIGLKANYTCPDNNNFLIKNNIYNLNIKNKEKIIKNKVNLKKCQKIKKNETVILIPKKKTNEKKPHIKKSRNIEIFSKNKGYSTYNLYIKKANLIFDQTDLYKKKIKKETKNKIIIHKSEAIKIIGRRKINIYNNFKNKKTIYALSTSEKEKSLESIIKDKHPRNEIYKKLLLKRINNQRNINKNEIFNHTNSLRKKNSILFNTFNDKNQHDIDYSYKRYINPFNKSEDKIRRNIKFLKYIKSKVKSK